LYFLHFIHTFGVYGQILKKISVIDKKIKFPVFSKKTSMTVRLPFCRFWAIFIIFTFSPISLVFMAQFSKFFELKISKLDFLSFEENNNDGQTAFLQVFGYFLYFSDFSHIFGVYGPIFKKFSVKDIKIKFLAF